MAIATAITARNTEKAMSRYHLPVLVSILFLLNCAGARAQEGDLEPYRYAQTFEGEDDPVEFWKSDGLYTVHFKGLTEERKRSGTRCFKLDVTIEDGSYVYWSIPVRCPVEGELAFSAHMLLGGETTGTAGLGLDFEVLPAGRSAQEAFTVCGSTGGEWKPIEGDAAALRT